MVALLSGLSLVGEFGTVRVEGTFINMSHSRHSVQCYTLLLNVMIIKKRHWKKEKGKKGKGERNSMS